MLNNKSQEILLQICARFRSRSERVEDVDQYTVENMVEDVEASGVQRGQGPRPAKGCSRRGGVTIGTTITATEQKQPISENWGVLFLLTPCVNRGNRIV
jgi:hypothetical protein